jgi:hypothetical protein
MPLSRCADPLVDLAREASSLPLFRDAIARGAGEAPIRDVAILLALLGGMAAGARSHPRKVLSRLEGLSPDEQRTEGLRLFGLDRVYHRETEPGRVRRLWRVLCVNLLAAAKYTPDP